MFFINNYPNYKLPSSSQVKFNYPYLKNLSFEEILELCKQPYSDENWINLAYSVSYPALQEYSYEYFERIVNNHYNIGNIVLSDKEVQSIGYNTPIRFPTYYETHEFRYYNSTSFIGAVGVFSINIKNEISDNVKLHCMGKLAQYSFFHNIYSRMLIAISYPDNDKWDLAYTEVLASEQKFYPPRSRKVKITLFKNNIDFFRAIYSSSRVNEIEHEEYIITIRVR